MKIFREINFAHPIRLPVFGQLNYSFDSVVIDANSESYTEASTGVEFALTDVDHNAGVGMVAIPMSNITYMVSVEVSDDA